MSKPLFIQSNEPIKNIGVFNKIQVVHIPFGVSLSVAFKDTPSQDEIFPLTASIADRDFEGDFVEDARECYLHIEGTNVDDIILICSNVTKESGYVDVQNKHTVALETDTKNAIESSTFKPSSVGVEQVSIASASSHTINKADLLAIRFHATDEIGLELDSCGFNYPLFEDILSFDNISSSVTFHNTSASAITLTVWKM